MIVRSRFLAGLFASSVAAGDLLENFLVGGVGAVLAIRFYLELTGYPQVGGGGLHIAHMLWGGLGMLIAIILLVGFLGRRIQHIAAFLGGIGLGTFIDELGKFVTSDNNYFFQPTIALIYIIFIALFLVLRALERHRRLTEREYLANALDLLKEAVLKELDEKEKAQALALLQQCNHADPLVGMLIEAITRAEVKPAGRPSLPERIARGAAALYQRFIRSRGFRRFLVGALVLYAVLVVASTVYTIVDDPRFSLHHPNVGFVDWAMLASSTTADALVVVGVAQLRWSRLQAYRWFKRSTLLSIFLVQVFAFYTEQLPAIAGLALDIVILTALDYMIAAEQAAALASTATVTPPAAYSTGRA